MHRDPPEETAYLRALIKEYRQERDAELSWKERESIYQEAIRRRGRWVRERIEERAEWAQRIHQAAIQRTLGGWDVSSEQG